MHVRFLQNHKSWRIGDVVEFETAIADTLCTFRIAEKAETPLERQKVKGKRQNSESKESVIRNPQSAIENG
jgi:hypothetical protein